MSSSAPRSFTIYACLGRGGFGEVYRAEMHRPGGIDAEVALKVLRRDVGLNGQAVQRLRDEGRLLARLSHPAILKVHDLLVLEGRVALVTEFVDGEDLSSCLQGADAMPLRALLEVISQVAGALDLAWTAPIGEKGGPLHLVHRDIKPSNIRIGKRGAVKLLDFGIARTDEVTREAKTMTDMLVGSPPYMAPERFLEDRVEPASDVFALGVTLAEGGLGRRLFDVPVTMLAGLAVDEERYSAFVDQRVAPLQEQLPAPVFALLRSMLSHDPEDRPAAKDLSRACQRLSDTVGGVSLTRWARERAWAPSTEEPGDLDGRSLVEGTLEAVRPAAPAAPPTLTTLSQGVAPAGVGLVMGGASVMVFIGSLGVLLVAVVLIAVAVWQPWTSSGDVVGRPEAPAAPAPDVVPSPAPEVPAAPAPAAPSPERVEAPRAAPEPVASPSPRPSPAPRPAPAPVAAPSPAGPPPAAADPDPAPARTGAVRTTGDAAARLEGNGERIDLPADVPAGSWRVEGNFRGQWLPTGKVLEVRAGRNHVVHCLNSQFNCTAE